MEPHKIWIKQCEAVEDIDVHHPSAKILGMLRRSNPLFARGLSTIIEKQPVQVRTQNVESSIFDALVFSSSGCLIIGC